MEQCLDNKLCNKIALRFCLLFLCSFPPKTSPNYCSRISLQFLSPHFQFPTHQVYKPTPWNVTMPWQIFLVPLPSNLLCFLVIATPLPPPLYHPNGDEILLWIYRGFLIFNSHIFQDGEWPYHTSQPALDMFNIHQVCSARFSTPADGWSGDNSGWQKLAC